MIAIRHKLEDRGSDLYETPPVATEALLRVESLPHHVWEPAAGRGAMVKVLRAAGHTVTATDLEDWGCPDSASRIDFLLERRAPDGVQAIVGNPPYKIANAFVEHAIELCPFVAFLLHLTFLEAQRRSAILSKLSRVHIFADRLPMLHRDGWTGKKSTSARAFAWFVWDARHTGPTTIDRIWADLTKQHKQEKRNG